MIRTLVRTAIGLAPILAGLAPSGAQAGLINYTAARVSAGVGSNSTGSLYDQQEVGGNSIAIGPLSGVRNSGDEVYAASGYAETNPFGDSFMKLSANVSSTQAGAQTGGQTFSVASAAWRDLVIVSDAVGRPDSIRLHFTIDGALQANRSNPVSGYSAGRAGIGIDFNTSEALRTVGFPSSTDVRFDDVFVRLADNSSSTTGFSSQGLSSFAGDSDGFIATFFHDAAYDATLGGYFWNMSVVADTFAGEGTAAAMFGNTIKLSAVTTTGGDRIAEGDLTFESGLRLSVVPEPNSLILSLCGVLSIALMNVRRLRGRQ